MSNSERVLFDSLNILDTEQINLQTKQIDLSDSLEIVTLMNAEDEKVSQSIKEKLHLVAEAIDLVSESLALGGRLLYFGAGTSGRLGVIDAAECPPTFGVNPEQVQGFIAGGKEAMFVAQEGAEDSEEVGVNDLNKSKASSVDIICGLAASGRTPYVLGVLKEAQRQGIRTIFITTVSRSQLTITADVIIDIPVGPEVIMGSTRLKSGTAQKMVLNMITTAAFIKQGKVLENVMVDLKLSNKKLVERAKRIVMSFGKVTYRESAILLKESNGHVKTAIVMAIKGINKVKADELLRKHNGFIRRALESEK